MYVLALRSMSRKRFSDRVDEYLQCTLSSSVGVSCFMQYPPTSFLLLVTPCFHLPALIIRIVCVRLQMFQDIRNLAELKTTMLYNDVTPTITP
jgi:hypothetical protein